MGLTEEQRHAIEAATNRTKDPLGNWTRPCLEECPICFLPMPCDFDFHCMRWACCGKKICGGCVVGQMENHVLDFSKASICPFCRTDNENNENIYRLEKEMEHATRGDPHYIFRIANYHFDGERGLEKNTVEGLRWYHRALEAGSAGAAYTLGVYYTAGNGVDQDLDKAVSYFQKAGDLGFISSYLTLGNLIMLRKGEKGDAVLNWRKAMMCGVESADLFAKVRSAYREGVITKEEYDFTLKAHQSSVAAMRSKAREEARDLWSEDDVAEKVIELNT